MVAHDSQAKDLETVSRVYPLTFYFILWAKNEQTRTTNRQTFHDDAMPRATRRTNRPGEQAGGQTNK